MITIAFVDTHTTLLNPMWAWIIPCAGLAVGLLSTLLLPNKGLGLMGNILFGIFGALIGGGIVDVLVIASGMFAFETGAGMVGAIIGAWAMVNLLGRELSKK